MIVVGINGNPGSGKTTVSQLIFSNENTKVVSLDRIYDTIKKNMPTKMVTQETRPDGNETVYLTHNGFYHFIKNSPLLSKVYRKLWRVLGHKLVWDQLELATVEGYDYVVLEGVSLFEFIDAKDLDLIIYVSADYDVRNSRVQKRNTDNEIKINNPIDIEVDVHTYDVHIDNSFSFEHLCEEVEKTEELFRANVLARKKV